METVIFTCTAPGDSLRWVPSDVSRITIRPTTSGVNVPLMPQPGYTVTLIAFNDTTITSTLSRIAENGINVSCVDPLPTRTTIGSSTIQLVGELQLVSKLASRHCCMANSRLVKLRVYRLMQRLPRYLWQLKWLDHMRLPQDH